MEDVISKSAHGLSEEQEHELALRCQNGDVSAMEQIVRQYQKWVYAVAYGKIGHPEDAKDIAQDVFLSVWENIGQFQFRSRFSTWLYRVVASRCLNEQRKHRQRKTTPMEIDDSQP